MTCIKGTLLYRYTGTRYITDMKGLRDGEPAYTMHVDKMEDINYNMPSVATIDFVYYTFNDIVYVIDGHIYSRLRTAVDAVMAALDCSSMDAVKYVNNLDRCCLE